MTFSDLPFGLFKCLILEMVRDALKSVQRLPIARHRENREYDKRGDE